MDKNINEVRNQYTIHSVTCSLCWWREGDRCYLEPCKRLKDEKSEKVVEMTDSCDQFKDKRNYFINALNGM